MAVFIKFTLVMGLFISIYFFVRIFGILFLCRIKLKNIEVDQIDIVLFLIGILVLIVQLLF